MRLKQAMMNLLPELFDLLVNCLSFVDVLRLRLINRDVKQRLDNDYFKKQNNIHNYVLLLGKMIDYQPPAKYNFTKRHSLQIFPKISCVFDKNENGLRIFGLKKMTSKRSLLITDPNLKNQTFINDKDERVSIKMHHHESNFCIFVSVGSSLMKIDVDLGCQKIQAQWIISFNGMDLVPHLIYDYPSPRELKKFKSLHASPTELVVVKKQSVKTFIYQVITHNDDLPMKTSKRIKCNKIPLDFQGFSWCLTDGYHIRQNGCLWLITPGSGRHNEKHALVWIKTGKTVTFSFTDDKQVQTLSAVLIDSDKVVFVLDHKNIDERRHEVFILIVKEDKSFWISRNFIKATRTFCYDVTRMIKSFVDKDSITLFDKYFTYRLPLDLSESEFHRLFKVCQFDIDLKIIDSH